MSGAGERLGMLSAVVADSPDFVAIVDITSKKLTYLNRVGRRFIGLDNEEEVGRTSVADFCNEEDFRRFKPKVMPSLSKKGSWEGEVRFRNFKTGATIPFWTKCYLIQDPKMAAPTVYAIHSRDISQLKGAQEELQGLSGRLLKSQDEERRRIARDLHDSTGQVLVALTMTLSRLWDSIPSDERKPRRLVSECKALASQCIREVRTLSYVLHPPMLDKGGLKDAILHYTDGFAERTGIEVKLEISPQFPRLAPDTELALFRIVQESFSNIQRHSGSLQAKLRLDCSAHEVTLEVTDKGCGISGSQRKPDGELTFGIGVGIPSMSERVKQIDGRLKIKSSGGGTTVRVTIPANEQRHQETSHPHS